MFDMTFEDFENSVPRRSRKTLVISFLFSVVAHGVAFGCFYNEKIIRLQEIPVSNQPLLHISLLPTQLSADSNQDPVVLRKEDLRATKQERIEPITKKVPVNGRSDSMKDIGHGLQSTGKSKIDEKNLKHSLNFESIRQAIRQREYENNYTTERREGTHFEPVIQQHINKKKKEIVILPR